MDKCSILHKVKYDPGIFLGKSELFQPVGMRETKDLFSLFQEILVLCFKLWNRVTVVTCPGFELVTLRLGYSTTTRITTRTTSTGGNSWKNALQGQTGTCGFSESHYSCSSYVVLTEPVQVFKRFYDFFNVWSFK